MSMSPPPLPRAVEEGLEPTEVGIAESHTLLSSFTSFLTVSIHTILYYRSIYPRHTFLSTKAYNLPVHQSRHPKVCSWIQDAVDAVAAQIAKGNVSRVAVVIHAPLSPPKLSTASSSAAASQLVPGSVLERWMFDVSLLPSWPGGAEAMKNFRSEGDGRREEEGEEPHADESGEDNAGDGDVAEGGAINWTDVDEQLRGAVRRLAYAGEKMDTLPEACTFTVAVELRGEAQAPIGHPQPWIPSQPSLQPNPNNRQVREKDVGGTKTTPVRAVEAGPLFFECWVEEGTAKNMFRATQSQMSKLSA